MTEIENKEPPPAPTVESPPAPPPAKKPARAVGFSAIIAVVALVTAAIAIWRTTETDAGLNEMATQMLTLADQARLEADLRRLEGTTATLAADIDDLEPATQGSLRNLEQADQELTEGLRALYAELSREAPAWSIAETGHLVRIANRSLMLERDVETAVAALRTADQQLAALSDPALLGIRRALAADLNDLAAVQPVDISGLSLYLADLAGRVADLPLADTSVTIESGAADAAVDPAAPAWRRLLGSVWQEFRAMFVITRTGGIEAATLLPDERYFLYQNLRLQIETARLAVIRHDTGLFRDSLGIIRIWLTRYFDTREAATGNILEAIDRMAGMELAPVLPDAGRSLQAIENYLSDASPRPQSDGSDNAP